MFDISRDTVLLLFVVILFTLEFDKYRTAQALIEN